VRGGELAEPWVAVDPAAESGGGDRPSGLAGEGIPGLQVVSQPPLPLAYPPGHLAGEPVARRDGDGVVHRLVLSAWFGFTRVGCLVFGAVELGKEPGRGAHRWGR
jgi:hypothetical protein